MDVRSTVFVTQH